MYRLMSGKMGNLEDKNYCKCLQVFVQCSKDTDDCKLIILMLSDYLFWGFPQGETRLGSRVRLELSGHVNKHVTESFT